MQPPAKPAAREGWRTFIALGLAPEIKQAIAQYLLPLKKLTNGISWVKSENLHFTLKFLGDTPVAVVPEIAAALGEICSRYEPVRAKISGSGVFPNEKRPRVLWLGCQVETASLGELAAEIDAACGRFGFQPEARAFAPHLTIGRVREGPASIVVSTMRNQKFSGPETIFDECVFMKSELHPAGSIYTRLDTFPFARTNA